MRRAPPQLAHPSTAADHTASLAGKPAQPALRAMEEQAELVTLRPPDPELSCDQNLIRTTPVSPACHAAHSPLSSQWQGRPGDLSFEARSIRGDRRRSLPRFVRLRSPERRFVLPIKGKLNDEFSLVVPISLSRDFPCGLGHGWTRLERALHLRPSGGALAATANPTTHTFPAWERLGGSAQPSVSA
eukprot:COSAG04_NODE_3490_length_2774_cov_2.288972_2_plen_187_part_00